MSNLFKSPSSTPTWTSPTGVDQSREGLLNALNSRVVSNALTQGPTDVQSSAASMLQGLMGSGFGTGYQTGQRTLEEAAQTGFPYGLENLRALEQQRMQQLPYEMAGVTEQLTARGMGGDTDLARILGETAGRAQTDIAATLAPYYLQAGEAQAGRRVSAAQPLMNVPTTAALGAMTAGNALRPAIDPVAGLLANLASQGGLAQTQYGPSTGSQLLQAGASILPWLGLTKSLPTLQNIYNAGSQGAQTVQDWYNSMFGNQGINLTEDNLNWLYGLDSPASATDWSSGLDWGSNVGDWTSWSGLGM